MTSEIAVPAVSIRNSGWRRFFPGRPYGWYALLSLILLLPCYWQPRVQAGDLSSHIYNSWLASLIETSHMDGLVLVSQTTNVLFDLLLGALFSLVGAEAAQRIAVSLSVLVFVWGAFAFTCTVSRRQPWHLMPSLAMLAYGWVFHMGFFNFYLSLGLCFWAMALLWKVTPLRVVAGVAILAVAHLAHALPVAWTILLIGYVWIARRLAPRHRVWLTAGAIVAIAATHQLLNLVLVSRWSPKQLTSSTGADQMWVFGPKYYLVLIGLLLAWGAMFLQVLHRHGVRRTILGIPFQVCILSAAVVTMLPTMILFPGFRHALVFIAERMSLGVGVCVCAMLASARPQRWARVAMTVLAVLFFALLYADEKALNRFEDEMQGVVAQVPHGARLFAVIKDLDSAARSTATLHTLDRVCIGHCFSYANYEPSSDAFRVRAVAPNAFAVSNPRDSHAIQMGSYVVKESDLPAFLVVANEHGKLGVRRLEAGSLCGDTWLRILPDLSFRTMTANRRMAVRTPSPGEV
jgi:hypothetical protein